MTQLQSTEMRMLPAERSGRTVATETLSAFDRAIGPEIGIYPNVPATAYHAWTLPSNSLISKLKRSPLQALEQMQHPKPPTEEMAFGTALHCLVLEPEKFKAEYTVADQCSAIKKGDGQPCEYPGVMRSGAHWYCGTHGKKLLPDTGLTVLPADEYAKAFVMAEAIKRHPSASMILGLPGETEVSAVFRDPQTDVICKMRADRLAKGRKFRAIVDIKTTKDASPARFPRSINDFGYHRQGALYLRGMASLGEAFDWFIIIAIEKTPPFDMAVYKVVDRALEAGAIEATELLMLYAECQRCQRWPGYGDGIIDVSLPEYELKRMEREEDFVEVGV